MRDIDIDSDAEKPYECFECGSIVVAEDNPVTCPDCGADVRNRQTPIE